MGDDGVQMQASASGLLLSSTGPDGKRLVARHSLAVQYVVHDWSQEPVACAAAAALAAALAESGAAPLEGCVEELQDMAASDGEYLVAARRVHASPEGFAHPLGSAAASLAELMALDDGNVKPAAVLLTHVFALPGDSQRLRLATLVLPQGRPEPRLLALVFGAGAHVALSSPEDRVFTDVSLGDAGSLSADALAALSSMQRDALRAALRVQRLAATAACVEARWSGGFCALQLGVTAMKPALGPALAALASHLAAPQSGGGPTRASLYALKQEAEALEAAGRFLEAAALYKRCLDADARNPGARLLQTPPQIWSFYGLALKRARRFSEARAAYDAGLRALEMGCHVEPDTPEWRESVRLSLYGFIVTLGQAMGDQVTSQMAYQRIFPAQFELFKAAGENAALGGGTSPTVTGTKTGRRFAVVHYQETSGPNSSVQLSRVEELPRVNPRSLPRSTPGWQQQTAQDAEAKGLVNARKVLANHYAAAVPKLPQARCALCSEAASKRCSACGGPAYCGAACQKQDWKSHKPACKAAQAAAAEKETAA
jgi:hypothetical protein